MSGKCIRAHCRRQPLARVRWRGSAAFVYLQAVIRTTDPIDLRGHKRLAEPPLGLREGLAARYEIEREPGRGGMAGV